MKKPLTRREWRVTIRAIGLQLCCLLRGHKWDMTRYEPRYAYLTFRRPASTDGGTNYRTPCKRCKMQLRHN